VIKELNGARAYIIKDYFAVAIVPLVDRVDGFMDEMEKAYKGKYEVVGEIGGAGGGGDPFEAHIPLFKDILLKHRETSNGAFRTAVTGLPVGRGIMPDREATAEIGDILTGRDLAMELAMRMIPAVED
jgi:hypothetical protein